MRTFLIEASVVVFIVGLVVGMVACADKCEQSASKATIQAILTK